jgi:hypothetical protein
MHEAGLLAAAIAEALAAGGSADGAEGSLPVRRPVALELTVHDPIHVGPEAAAMHAELALLARGFGNLPITVACDPVTCAICGAANEVVAGHPFCSDCGMPLPDRGGDAVEARVWWADEMGDPGAPRLVAGAAGASALAGVAGVAG